MDGRETSSRGAVDGRETSSREVQWTGEKLPHEAQWTDEVEWRVQTRIHVECLADTQLV